MTVNRVNLFEIIKTLYHNKTVLQKNSIYIDEFAQMLHRGQKDLKDDVMLLASLEYVKTDFIGDTVNQRLVLLTPKSMRVMDRTTPPRDYEEFIQMFENLYEN